MLVTLHPVASSSFPVVTSCFCRENRFGSKPILTHRWLFVHLNPIETETGFEHPNRSSIVLGMSYQHVLALALSLGKACIPWTRHCIYRYRAVGTFGRVGRKACSCAAQRREKSRGACGTFRPHLLVYVFGISTKLSNAL